MPSEENTVDVLMSLDPLDLTAANIDSIIAHHRKNRANAAAGIKPKREQGPKIDIEGIMGKLLAGGEVLKPAAGGIRRR